MSMSIGGNLSINAYSSATAARAAKSTPAATAETATAATTAATETKAAYNPTAYLKELNERSTATISVGAWNGKSQFGDASGTSVMIHPAFLEKMYNDPELGAYYEEQIDLSVKLDQQFIKQLDSQGIETLSMGTYIDENGNMSCCGMVRTKAGSEGASPLDRTKKSAKEIQEEMLERIKEKRAAEKEAAAKAETSVDATKTSVDVYI